MLFSKNKIFSSIKVDDIADAVASSFRSTFESTLQKVANEEAAQIINTISTSIPFSTAELILNMQGGVSLFPASSPNLIIYGLGAFSPLNNPQNPPFGPSIAPPDSVFQSPSGQFEVIYTDFLLLSAAWAENLLGAFNRTIDNSDVPSNSPVHLTTNDAFFTESVPGLAAYPNMNITVTTSLVTLPTIQTSSGGIIGNVPIRCHFSLINSTYSHDGFIVDLAIGFIGTVVTSMPDASTIRVNSTIGKYTVIATQIATAVGPITTTLWDALLSYALSFISPQIPPESFSIPTEFSASGVFDSLGSQYGIFGTSSFSYAVKVPQVPCSSSRVNFLFSFFINSKTLNNQIIFSKIELC